MILQSQWDAIPGYHRQKVAFLSGLSDLDGNFGGHKLFSVVSASMCTVPGTRESQHALPLNVNPAQHRASMTRDCP